MLFELLLHVAEGVFAARQDVLSTANGVEGAGRQRKSQGQCLLVRSMIFRENAMQLDEVRFVTLQQPAEFVQPARHFSSNLLLRIDMFIAERNVHDCTCREFTD